MHCGNCSLLGVHPGKAEQESTQEGAEDKDKVKEEEVPAKPIRPAREHARLLSSMLLRKNEPQEQKVREWSPAFCI